MVGTELDYDPKEKIRYYGRKEYDTTLNPEQTAPQWMVITSPYYTRQFAQHECKQLRGTQGKLTEVQWDQCMLEYGLGYGTQALKEKYNISPTSIQRKARTRGIKPPWQGNAHTGRLRGE